MLETRSALAKQLIPGRIGAGTGIVFQEVRGRAIVQAAGWPDGFAAVAQRLAAAAGCTVPPNFRIAGVADTVTAIWTGPERLWFTADASDLMDRLRVSVTDEEAVLLDLSHSRTILRVSGEKVRAVLEKGVPVDLHPQVFPVQAVAQTMVAQTGVLLHRVGPEAFEFYVPRSMARSFWHWMTASAAEFGYEAR